MIMDSRQQKVDVRVDNIAIQIPPVAVRTILNMAKSMNKLQVIEC